MEAILESRDRARQHNEFMATMLDKFLEVHKRVTSALTEVKQSLESFDVLLNVLQL